MDKIMEENQKKIEEQQKKMVRFFFYCNVRICFYPLNFRPRTG